MLRRARAVCVVSLAMVGASLVSTSTAGAAGSEWIAWNEALIWSGKFETYAKPLGQVSTYALDGQGWVGCAGAYDVPTGAWAGVSSCAEVIVTHPYCYCGYRLGWGGGGFGNTPVRESVAAAW